jgi:DNA-binding transcriptional regulator YiaG
MDHNNHYAMLVFSKNQLTKALLQETRVSFSDAFGLAQKVLSLSDNDLAKIYQVSRSTIARWATYRTAPHRLGRVSVLKYLLEQTEEKISVFEKTN